MSSLVQVLLDAPVPIVTVALVLRFGPSALILTIAGATAVLVSGERGARALAVLQLLRSSSTSGRRRGNGHDCEYASAAGREPEPRTSKGRA